MIRPEDAHKFCDAGPYHPTRIGESPFGWGVRHTESGVVFALIGEKHAAFGCAAALNGHYEAAEVFLKTAREIPLSYFDRFKGLNHGR